MPFKCARGKMQTLNWDTAKESLVCLTMPGRWAGGENANWRSKDGITTILDRFALKCIFTVIKHEQTQTRFRNFIHWLYKKNIQTKSLSFSQDLLYLFVSSPFSPCGSEVRWPTSARRCYPPPPAPSIHTARLWDSSPARCDLAAAGWRLRMLPPTEQPWSLTHHCETTLLKK